MRIAGAVSGRLGIRIRCMPASAGRAPALPAVAGDAAGDDVLPVLPAALGDRHHVVEGQLAVGNASPQYWHEWSSRA